MRKTFLAALFIPAAAHASDWVQTGYSNTSITYTDASSIRSLGAGLRETWEKTMNNVPDAEGVSYSIAHWRYNCDQRQVMLLSWVTYGAGGNNIMSQTLPEYARTWKDVVPDTTGEREMNYACSR
jgi:hypothetical protein